MWSSSAAERATARESPLAALDALVGQLARATRVLPALIPKNAWAERARLTQALTRGEPLVPRWTLEPRAPEPALHRALATARQLVEAVRGHPLGDLYAERLEELELDVALVEALDRAPLVRPLARRRYGDGATKAHDGEKDTTLGEVARRLLAQPAPAAEPLELPTDGGPRSMAGAMRVAIMAAGLEVEVRVEPRLSAGAAAGDRTIFVAARRFGRRECQRLVAHEVLGHAVAAANGALHPLRLVETGTAQSFADQEGVAIVLEEAAGVLDPARVRVLAARVVATDAMHAGASFAETARVLHEDLGLGPDLSIAIAERAHRGGGVARDAGYLAGYLRVRGAIARGEVTLDELRAGRVSVRAVSVLRALGVPLRHRPDLAVVLARVRVAIEA
ncbi:MAG: DUF1704 domain-containing protein [Sandaracinus sp.]